MIQQIWARDENASFHSFVSRPFQMKAGIQLYDQTFSIPTFRFYRIITEYGGPSL